MTTNSWITKCQCISEMKVEMNGERPQNRDQEKSSQMALVRGYCLLEGPPRLVAPFGRLWKRCSFPLASLMTDFLEAVLREMASSVVAPLSLLVANPHPLTQVTFSPPSMQALTVTPSRREVLDPLGVTSSPTYDPNRHPCSPTLILSPIFEDQVQA